MKKTIVFLLAGLLLGCASLDFQETEFRPLPGDSEHDAFEFKAYADAIYPHDSETAEQVRMGWLEKWLRNSGYEMESYQIERRHAVKKQDGLLGDVYEIYYVVKVPTK